MNTVTIEIPEELIQEAIDMQGDTSYDLHLADYVKEKYLEEEALL